MRFELGDGCCYFPQTSSSKRSKAIPSTAGTAFSARSRGNTMITMTYKEYIAQIVYSEEDGVLSVIL